MFPICFDTLGNIKNPPFQYKEYFWCVYKYNKQCILLNKNFTHIDVVRSRIGSKPGTQRRYFIQHFYATYKLSTKIKKDVSCSCLSNGVRHCSTSSIPLNVCAKLFGKR